MLDIDNALHIGEIITTDNVKAIFVYSSQSHKDPFETISFYMNRKFVKRLIIHHSVHGLEARALTEAYRKLIKLDNSAVIDSTKFVNSCFSRVPRFYLWATSYRWMINELNKYRFTE